MQFIRNDSRLLWQNNIWEWFFFLISFELDFNPPFFRRSRYKLFSPNCNVIQCLEKNWKDLRYENSHISFGQKKINKVAYTGLDSGEVLSPKLSKPYIFIIVKELKNILRLHLELSLSACTNWNKLAFYLNKNYSLDHGLRKHH